MGDVAVFTGGCAMRFSDNSDRVVCVDINRRSLETSLLCYRFKKIAKVFIMTKTVISINISTYMASDVQCSKVKINF